MNYFLQLKNILFSFGIFTLFISCNNKKSENSIHSLLVYKKGALIEEQYLNGRVNTDIDNVQSITKTIITMLVDIAITNGDLSSDQVSVLDFFPELGIPADDRKHHILSLIHI